MRSIDYKAVFIVSIGHGPFKGYYKGATLQRCQGRAAGWLSLTVIIGFLIFKRMIKATYEDKAHIVDILSHSFYDNKSVNYLFNQGQEKHERLRKLMSYSFEVCYAFGEVWLSADRAGCALLIYPDRKRTTLPSIYWDIKLAIGCLGLSGLRKALTRETRVKQLHPAIPFTYLWFIGVAPGLQHKGTGSQLLQDVLKASALQQRPVYLETSVLNNLPWYKKAGFSIYRELNFGYQLYCLTNNPDQAVSTL